jgi:hypothetical protein
MNGGMQQKQKKMDKASSVHMTRPWGGGGVGRGEQRWALTGGNIFSLMRNWSLPAHHMIKKRQIMLDKGVFTEILTHYNSTDDVPKFLVFGLREKILFRNTVGFDPFFQCTV